MRIDFWGVTCGLIGFFGSMLYIRGGHHTGDGFEGMALSGRCLFAGVAVGIVIAFLEARLRRR